MGVGQGMTHGESLNNPGNIIIRDAAPWLGLLPATEPLQTGEQGELHLCHFATPLHGIRALCTVLLSYQRLQGCRTLAQMIRRWVPSGDPDIEVHIAAAEKGTGIPRDGPIDLDHPGDLAAAVRAIICHENGRCLYDRALIVEAVTSALAT
jgi:hypothetical protein